MNNHMPRVLFYGFVASSAVTLLAMLVVLISYFFIHLPSSIVVIVQWVGIVTGIPYLIVYGWLRNNSLDISKQKRRFSLPPWER